MVATGRVIFKVEAGLMETGKGTPVKAAGVVRGKAVTDLMAVIRAAIGQVAAIRVVTEQAAAIKEETGAEAVTREATELEAVTREATEQEAAGIRVETELEAAIRATGQKESVVVAGKVEKDKAVVIREETGPTAAVIREATDLMVIVPVEVIREAIAKVGISRGVDTREEITAIKVVILRDPHAMINQVDMGKQVVITRVI